MVYILLNILLMLLIFALFCFAPLLCFVPGFQNSWKMDPVALEPLKQPTKVSMLIHRVGFKLIQDSGLQEGGTPLYHLRFSADK